MKSIHIKSRAGGAPNTFHSKTERNRVEAVSISIYTRSLPAAGNGTCCLLLLLPFLLLSIPRKRLHVPLLSLARTIVRFESNDIDCRDPERLKCLVTVEDREGQREDPLITIYENEFIREGFYRARRIRYNCVYVSSSNNKIDRFSTRWMIYG